MTPSSGRDVERRQQGDHPAAGVIHGSTLGVNGIGRRPSTSSGRSSTRIPHGARRWCVPNGLAAAGPADPSARHRAVVDRRARAPRARRSRRRPGGAAAGLRAGGRAVDAPALAARVTISLAFEIGHTGDIAARAGAARRGRGRRRPAATGRASPTSAASSSTASVALEAAIAEVGRRPACRRAPPPTVGCRAARRCQPRGRSRASAVTHDAARACLLDAIDLAAELGQLVVGRAGPRQPRVRRDDGGQPARGPRRLRRRRGRLPPDRHPARPAAAARRPRARPRRCQPARRRRGPDRSRRRASRRPSGNDLELAELLLVSAEIDLAQGASPTRPTSARPTRSPRFARQGRDSWLHVAERSAAAGRGAADARRAVDRRAASSMNGRRPDRPAAGGPTPCRRRCWPPCCTPSTGATTRPALLLAEVGPAAARGRGARPDPARPGRRDARRAQAATGRRPGGR